MYKRVPDSLLRYNFRVQTMAEHPIALIDDLQFQAPYNELCYCSHSEEQDVLSGCMSRVLDVLVSILISSKATLQVPSCIRIDMVSDNLARIGKVGAVN